MKFAARIRAGLRSWLGVKDPEPTRDEIAPGLKIDPTAFVYFGSQPVVARPIHAPKLLPGVVPENANAPVLANDAGLACGPHFLAMDSEQFAPLWSWLQDVNSGLGFPGYAYLSQLTQRSEYRSPAETMASEMTREWIQLKTKGKTEETDDSDERQADDAALPPSPKDKAEEDDAARMDDDGAPAVISEADKKIEDIEAALEEFKVREHFRRVIEQDWFFGRSQLFLDVDPSGADVEQEDETPRTIVQPTVLRTVPLMIDPQGIPKGSLRGFKVIEPIWTTPYYYNATDPTAKDFYKPIAWYVLGQKIHASRLLTFIAREVPDLLKPAYNFGGISMSQLMEPYVFQWLRTRNSVSDLIHTFSIIKLATNMTAVLAGTAGAAKGLMDRMKLFTQNRDNQGIFLLDKNQEELGQEAVPLSGLGELQAQAQEHMAAPTHIPLVKLLGVTPTGLNASSEGEIKVFYDYVRSQQQIYSPHLQTVLEVIQLHLFGHVDDSITFEWVPLTSPSIKELADIRKADADTGVAYVNAGVVSADEERQRLIADPNSGYTGLSGPAPEPPAPDVDPETGLPIEGPPGAGGGAPPFGKKPGAEEDDA